MAQLGHGMVHIFQGVLALIHLSHTVIELFGCHAVIENDPVPHIDGQVTAVLRQQVLLHHNHCVLIMVHITGHHIPDPFTLTCLLHEVIYDDHIFILGFSSDSTDSSLSRP